MMHKDMTTDQLFDEALFLCCKTFLDAMGHDVDDIEIRAMLLEMKHDGEVLRTHLEA